MEKEKGNEVVNSNEITEKTGDARDINAININYMRMLKVLCNVYEGRFKNVRNSPYYEQVFEIERAKQRQKSRNFSEDSFEIPKQCIGKRLVELRAEAQKVNGEIHFEKLCAKYSLRKDEQIILALLFFKRLANKPVKGMELLRIAGLINFCEPFKKLELISDIGNLKKNMLIEEQSNYRTRDNELIINREFIISEKAFWAITGTPDTEEPQDNATNKHLKPVKVISLKNPEVSFENLILSGEIKGQLENAMWQYQNSDRIFTETGIKDKLSYGRATTMLFYGPPGTGKTATSEAIAKYLGKKVGVVGYNKIFSMWLGDSEKRMVEVFNEAKQNDCVLVFDEADSLFAGRVNERHSTDRIYNIMTNILMQEIERFSGIVILTTNREVVIDEAFNRRLLFKLKFEIPSQEERTKIWQVLLKDCPSLSADVSFDELGRYPLAGGNIKNVVVKVIMKCAKENKNITMSDLTAMVNQETTHKRTQEKNIGF
jgi:SpoVK/Ycf46/Vps4 family AAA+-type ATPase